MNNKLKRESKYMDSAIKSSDKKDLDKNEIEFRL
jgi:hypothetical protein